MTGGYVEAKFSQFYHLGRDAAMISRSASALKRVRVTDLDEADGYKFRMFRQLQGAGILVVTFDVISCDIGDTPWGFPFLIEEGFDHIHVWQKSFSHYQHLPLEKFVEIVTPFCRDRAVITYGCSVGGYAAIYFGGVIDAKIIAGSPVNYTDEVFTDPIGRRIGEMCHQPLWAVPTSSKPPAIFCDPANDRDARLYLQECVFPVYQTPEIYLVEGSGHEVFRGLAARGQLKQMVLQIVGSERSMVQREKIMASAKPLDHT